MTRRDKYNVHNNITLLASRHVKQINIYRGKILKLRELHSKYYNRIHIERGTLLPHDSRSTGIPERDEKAMRALNLDESL